MEERKSITAGAVVYLLLLAACIALIRPFVNTGVSDDFSFIKSAKDFADTGRMVYNGWSAPMLGWMLPLGALFIKLFGFSFTAVRFASFLIAAVNGVLLQWILLRLGCTRVIALFGATAVMLSPLSLPEVVLFFTDQPGLLAEVVTLVLCIRIVRAETARATHYWIATAFLTSFVLGTARQLSWICTLVMVPSAMWLVRKRKAVIPWAAACFVLAIGGMAAMTHWFNRQPYALSYPLLVHYPLSAWARYLVLPGLELMVELAPVLSLFLIRRVPRGVYAASAALLVLVPLIMARNPYDLLHLVARDLFGIAPQWFVLFILAYSFALLPIALRTAYEALVREQSSMPRGELDLRQLLVVLAPFSFALFVLVSTRGAFFSRYLLGVMATVAIWLIKVWADDGRKSCGVAGPVLVVVYCAFSVIQAHDLFRQMDAALSLTQWYTSQGLPREELEAGFSFDGWYQIQRTGYINMPMIKVPADAYVNHDLQADIAPCHNFFLPYTPSIRPIYGVSETAAPCFEEPVLHTAQYSTWEAPHRHEVFIAKYAPKYALPVR